jgi:error-prone DNA polymerase
VWWTEPQARLLPLLVFVHLHTRSWFSFGAGGSSPEALATRAAELGQPALGLTDLHGVYGMVRFQKACKAMDLHAVVGAEVLVDGAPLILLARSPTGYRDLCSLLTRAHLASAGLQDGDLALLGERIAISGTRTVADVGSLIGDAQTSGAPFDCDPSTDDLTHDDPRTAPNIGDVRFIGSGDTTPLNIIPPPKRPTPTVSMEQLAAQAEDLICLTGGRLGTLWQLASHRQEDAAIAWLRTLREIFDGRPGGRLYVELIHGLLPEDGTVAARLHQLAATLQLPTVVTNEVRFATRANWQRYDLLTCARLNIRVSEPHAERPRNAEAYLKSEAQLRRLLPYPEAFDRTVEIAESCRVDLVPEYITPPAAIIPKGKTARSYLTELCDAGLRDLYAPDKRAKAQAQYDLELKVITDLELEEFFLVVHEVVTVARERGIRCAGRGSAANSIIAFLLRITAVDPIRHNLLFERFLHGGRKGTPDIDVDFDSDRRDEVIDWMERRFGIEQTAMTATLITYKLRLALRDVAKALGWPMPRVDALSQTVPSGQANEVTDYREQITGVLGDAPLVDLLLERVADLHLCPRHLGLHSGGMILSRKPLSHFTPIQVSANGVKMVTFDKLDVEAMGLVKLDVLGLRMMACLSEGAELIQRHEGIEVDFMTLPLDDPGVYELICSGQTVTLFQIESQGQMHLIAQNQPECFDDLVAEVALFRPGPLQSGMVHPFVRRRRGLEPVIYEHPSLEPILADTYGVILFQEQILDVAHRFAGMSMADADDFRQLMSKSHDPVRMGEMGGQFIDGAVAKGVPRPIAESVFEKVSHFVGYGFCRSHAAAFAMTVYHSAWMKRYHPAAHLAAFMQHRPGFYNLMTIEEEARRFGIPTLLPTIDESTARYDLVRLDDGRLGIRKPLSSIKGLAEEAIEQILWARLAGSFRSVEDLATRVPDLDRRDLDALAKSGALDTLAGTSRRALWEAGVVANRREAAGDRSAQPSLFDMPLLTEEDVPDLPTLSAAERLSWDYRSIGAGRVHPITLARRHLNDLGIPTIESCQRTMVLAGDGTSPKSTPNDLQGPVVTLAGIVIMRQRPPTAKGFMFVTLEDETGFIQVIVHPKVYEKHYDLLIKPALLFKGPLQATGEWRALMAREVWPLEGIFGGYAGFPSAAGHQNAVDAGEEAVRTGKALEGDGTAGDDLAKIAAGHVFKSRTKRTG